MNVPKREQVSMFCSFGSCVRARPGRSVHGPDIGHDDAGAAEGPGDVVKCRPQHQLLEIHRVRNSAMRSAAASCHVATVWLRCRARC